eukprot:753131-Hanusia_phi.AAC.5
MMRPHVKIRIIKSWARNQRQLTCLANVHGEQRTQSSPAHEERQEEESQVEDKLPALYRLRDIQDLSAALHPILLRRLNDPLVTSAPWDELVRLLQPWEACMVMNQIARVCPKK